jgi:hypothetical protein
LANEARVFESLADLCYEKAEMIRKVDQMIDGWVQQMPIVFDLDAKKARCALEKKARRSFNAEHKSRNVSSFFGRPTVYTSSAILQAPTLILFSIFDVIRIDSIMFDLNQVIELAHVFVKELRIFFSLNFEAKITHPRSFFGCHDSTSDGFLFP